MPITRNIPIMIHSLMSYSDYSSIRVLFAGVEISNPNLPQINTHTIQINDASVNIEVISGRDEDAKFWVFKVTANNKNHRLALDINTMGKRFDVDVEHGVNFTGDEASFDIEPGQEISIKLTIYA